MGMELATPRTLSSDPSESSDLDGDGLGDNQDFDRDGDGVLNGDDDFPDNGGEWVDTDFDGFGNNQDADDDNDGVEDFADSFPLDARGSRDSDFDGMPDEWETSNGLDPNDASDAELDFDRDGTTAFEEFEENSSPEIADAPAQILDIVGAESLLVASPSTVKFVYNVSDANANLTGLGFRVHFSSSIVEEVMFEDLYHWT